MLEDAWLSVNEVPAGWAARILTTGFAPCMVCGYALRLRFSCSSFLLKPLSVSTSPIFFVCCSVSNHSSRAFQCQEIVTDEQDTERSTGIKREVQRGIHGEGQTRDAACEAIRDPDVYGRAI